MGDQQPLGDALPILASFTLSKRDELVEHRLVALTGGLAGAAEYWWAFDMLEIKSSSLFEREQIVGFVNQQCRVGKTEFNRFSQVKTSKQVKSFLAITGC